MRLTLNDGTVLEDASLIRSSGNLFLYIPGLTLAEVFELLIDPEKTVKITSEDGPIEKDYEQYTRLIAVRDEETMITAILTREAETDV